VWQQRDSAAGLMNGMQAGFEEGGNSGNIQLSTFDLPNKKGSGADLLVNASVTFAYGRRYVTMRCAGHAVFDALVGVELIEHR
jgi:hypothetical protein